MYIYDINGNPINVAFDWQGEEIRDAYTQEGDHIPLATPLDYTEYTITDLFTYVENNFNGFDVYNGIIAQLMNSNKLYLFDLAEQTVIATALAITSAHGDSASFSREKYAETDEFPLLYVTSDANPALVYVNRITRSETTKIRTLNFPLDKTGYYAAHAYDESNRIMYMVGYSEQNYTTDDGGNNKTLVSKWNMSALTNNSDGTLTPAFVSSYERDFIFVMQGLQFFDGYIWISSGYANGQAQYIYAMRPSDGVIDYTITLDDTIEVEGLAWVYDSASNKYWMLVGQQNGARGLNYSRIDFAERE